MMHPPYMHSQQILSCDICCIYYLNMHAVLCCSQKCKYVLGKIMARSCTFCASGRSPGDDVWVDKSEGSFLPLQMRPFLGSVVFLGAKPPTALEPQRQTRKVNRCFSWEGCTFFVAMAQHWRWQDLPIIWGCTYVRTRQGEVLHDACLAPELQFANQLLLHLNLHYRRGVLSL